MDNDGYENLKIGLIIVGIVFSAISGVLCVYMIVEMLKKQIVKQEASFTVLILQIPFILVGNFFLSVQFYAKQGVEPHLCAKSGFMMVFCDLCSMSLTTHFLYFAGQRSNFSNDIINQDHSLNCKKITWTIILGIVIPLFFTLIGLGSFGRGMSPTWCWINLYNDEKTGPDNIRIAYAYFITFVEILLLSFNGKFYYSAYQTRKAFEDEKLNKIEIFFRLFKFVLPHLFVFFSNLVMRICNLINAFDNHDPVTLFWIPLIARYLYNLQGAWYFYIYFRYIRKLYDEMSRTFDKKEEVKETFCTPCSSDNTSIKKALLE